VYKRQGQGIGKSIASWVIHSARPEKTRFGDNKIEGG